MLQINCQFGVFLSNKNDLLCILNCVDVIWVILSVEVGGLLGVTQQLSSFETEFNTQPHRNVEGDFNPFASPQKNKQDANEETLKDTRGPWVAPLDSIQQDQNGLSHNSVNITPNGLQNNLSVVTYSQVSTWGFFLLSRKIKP